MKNSLGLNIFCIILLLLMNLLEFFFPSDITLKYSLIITIPQILYFIFASIPKFNKYIRLANILMFIILITITLWSLTLPLELLGYYILLIVFLDFKIVFHDQENDLQAIKKIILTIFIIMSMFFIIDDFFYERLFDIIDVFQELVIIINAIYCFNLLAHLSIPDELYTTK